MSETQKGTAQGAGIGAVAGALLGAAVGGGKGAATGAAMEKATASAGVSVTQTTDNRLKLDIPSVVRAEAARDYLVSRGVARNRIATDGRGAREPIADNGTQQGHNKNRPVEIYVAEQVASK